jgi:preprotein translocase subunit SecF
MTSSAGRVAGAARAAKQPAERVPLRFFQVIPPDTRINFIGAFPFAGIVSALLVIGSLVAMMTIGFNYGIDFAGGVEVRLEFTQPPDIGALRDAVTAAGFQGTEVTTFQIPGRHVYSVRCKGAENASGDTEATNASGDVASALFGVAKQLAGGGEVQIVSNDLVGPRAGAELRQKALWAIVSALIGMLVYVGYRFDFRYAPGAIIALFHDVIIVAGVFVVLRMEFDLTVLAGLLTIAGYSINDTIIIFDRIRESRARADLRRLPLPQIANRAINETLSRTLLTSGTTLLAVVSLFSLGGPVIRNFSFAMLCGVLVGTYSSVYIATPIFLYLERLLADWKMGRRPGRRRKEAA